MKKGHKDYLSNWILVDLIYLRFHRKRKVSQAYIYIYNKQHEFLTILNKRKTKKKYMNS
jgi:hypothetical protein